MIAVYILTGLYGFCVGSFLNVVIYRIPNNMSIVKPASHCPACGYTLKWYDNIPLLSYVFLKGKCRKCNCHISFRYTAVELINTFLWLLSVYLWFEDSFLYSIAAMLFCSVLICICFIDLETMYIHDCILYLLAIPVLLGVFANPSSISDKLIGAAMGGGGLFLFRFAFKIIAKREGMGISDAVLISFIGGFLGIGGVLLTVFISSVVGSISLICVQLYQKKKGSLNECKEYPFAPFLTLGGLISLFTGETLISFYLGLFDF